MFLHLLKLFHLKNSSWRLLSKPMCYMQYLSSGQWDRAQSPWMGGIVNANLLFFVVNSLVYTCDWLIQFISYTKCKSKSDELVCSPSSCHCDLYNCHCQLHLLHRVRAVIRFKSLGSVSNITSAHGDWRNELIAFARSQKVGVQGWNVSSPALSSTRLCVCQ